MIINHVYISTIITTSSSILYIHQPHFDKSMFSFFCNKIKLYAKYFLIVVHLLYLYDYLFPDTWTFLSAHCSSILISYVGHISLLLIIPVHTLYSQLLYILIKSCKLNHYAFIWPS